MMSGATATPTSNAQIWLHCANIFDKDYTTIEEILADQTTFSKLILNENACDYLIRSTSWASAITSSQIGMSAIGSNNYCTNRLLANSTWRNVICNSKYFESILKVKVPTMTSMTTPSGIVTNSATYNNDDWCKAYHIFDGDLSCMNGFIHPNNGKNGWFTYEFPQKMLLYRFDYRNREGGGTDSGKILDPCTTYNILGYDDTNGWEDISGTIYNDTTTLNIQTIILNPTKAYKKYKWQWLSGPQGDTSYAQFYGRTPS